MTKPDVRRGRWPVAGGEETRERSIWRPVRDGNAFESTVQRLAQAIKLGAVPDGDRLPLERELSEKLQVSRGTLREAIKALREAGLVESRPGRHGGTFVVHADNSQGLARPAEARAPSADALRDLIVLRQVVEPGAAGIAAAVPLSGKDRAHLVERLEASFDRDRTVQRLNDRRLHLAIAAATGSTSVTSVVADLQLRLDGYIADVPLMSANLDHSDRQHAAIVEAILAGDSAKARVEMEEHVNSTSLLLEALLS